MEKERQEINESNAIACISVHNIQGKDIKDDTVSNMDVITAIPALAKVWNAGTLKDYFEETTAPLAGVQPTLETALLKEVIEEEVTRLYGAETGVAARQQLTAFPVVETGTHLAFPRDYDGPGGGDLRARLNQNVLISAMLNASRGYPLHIGIYGSNVSLKHGCSGGYFQLGDSLFPVATSRVLEKHVLYDAAPLSEEFFGPAHKLTAKLALLYHYLKAEDESAGIYKTLEEVLGVHTSKPSAPVIVQKRYEGLPKKKFLVEKAFQDLNQAVKEKMGVNFSDIDDQYEVLAHFFGTEASLPDAVAKIQSHEINSILEGVGIRHVSLDICEVSRKFMIRALENKDSFWYRVFSNPELFSAFQKQFQGIRAGWKEHEAPLDSVRKNDNGFCQIRPCLMEGFDSSPENVAGRLKAKEFIPSSAMMMLVFQSSGVLAHGGFFQTGYAQEIKDRFASFLREHHEDVLEKNVQKLDTSMVLLSLACFANEQGPLKLSDIKKSNLRKGMLMGIPWESSDCAVRKGLNTLKAYLKLTAPGYVQSKSEGNTPPVLLTRQPNFVPIKTAERG